MDTAASDNVCVYVYGGGDTWAPLITTPERAEMYISEYEAIPASRMPLQAPRKPAGEFSEGGSYMGSQNE